MRTLFNILTVFVAALLVIPTMVFAASGSGKEGDPARVEQKLMEDMMKIQREQMKNNIDQVVKPEVMLDRNVDRIEVPIMHEAIENKMDVFDHKDDIFKDELDDIHEAVEPEDVDNDLEDAAEDAMEADEDAMEAAEDAAEEAMEAAKDAAEDAEEALDEDIDKKVGDVEPMDPMASAPEAAVRGFEPFDRFNPFLFDDDLDPFFFDRRAELFEDAFEDRFEDDDDDKFNNFFGDRFDRDRFDRKDD